MRKLSGYGPSLVVLATALLVLLAGPLAVRQIAFAQSRTQAVEASNRLANSAILEELQQSYRDIAAMVEPSVVHISTAQLIRDSSGSIQPYGSSGSGWLYDTDGHIVTNAHVVEDATEIQVQLNSGDLVPAEIVGRDRGTDIAVLRIAPGRLISATRTGSDSIRQGDIVFAFGSPFEFRFSMSQGVISGIGRSAGLENIEYEDFIQVDAAINPGNSGGPLTNIRGQVIGMNTAIATGRGNTVGNGQFAGIGLAIPMSMIESVVEQLISTGQVTKGYLGVELDDDRHLAIARAAGFTGSGVAVRVVQPDGPAAAAGIRQGDVVTLVDERRIDSLAQLRSTISSKRPGDVVRLHIWRLDPARNQFVESDVNVTLTRLDPKIYGQRAGEQIRELGLEELSTATRESTREAGVAFHRGVLVDQVTPGSVYEGVIQSKSIIVAVAGRDVASLDEFYQAIGRHNLVRGVMLRVITPAGQPDDVPLMYRPFGGLTR